MSRTLKISTVIALVSLFFSFKVYSQGQIERSFTGTSYLETRQDFIYRYKYIPVLDATYHEFSSDQVNWHKLYVAGDCYVRFTNKTDNSANPHGEASGYHPASSWWVLDICALDSTNEVGIDTLYIDYGTEIDTLFPGEFTIKFNLPDTVSGTSTNYQDSLTHTHLLQIYLNDNLDVDAYPTDGQVLKWNSAVSQWIAAPDLVGGGGGSLRVTEEDNLPSVNAVTEIRVPNSHLINNGAGSVSLILSVSPVYGANDYWRTGIETSSGEGTHTLTFSSPLPSDDYIVASVFGVYPNSMRQNLVYGNQTVNGFDVYGVMDSLVQIHYLAIRNVDSLLAVMAEMGKVLSNPLDTVYGYLSNKVDDSTIVVRNNELHVVRALDSDSLFSIAASEYALYDSITFQLVTDNDSVTNHKIIVDGIKSTYFQMDTLNTPSRILGKMEYNAEDEGVNLYLPDNITLQVGDELYIRGRNSTGSIITEGTPVSIISGAGAHTFIAPTDITNKMSALGYAGIATQDIGLNEYGRITVVGKVHDINTNHLTEGAPVYVGLGSTTTSTQPAAGLYTIIVGACNVKGVGNGEINCLRVIVPKLEDLSNVDGTALSKTGQILVWNNDSSYFDPNYNIVDTTANVNFNKVHIDSLTVGNIGYTDTYWTDLSIPLTAAAAGVAAPSLLAFRGSGIYARAFAGTTQNDEVYVEGQFPHSIKDSSDIYIHLHVSPSTLPAATDTAVVQIEYIWGAYDEVFPTSTTVTTKIPLGGKAQWEHIMHNSIPAIPAIGEEHSSIFMARITRLQDHASDNYAQNLFIFNFDIHYELDKPGSNNITP